MNKQNLLNRWGVWLSFLTEQQQKSIGYSNRLKRTFQIKTIDELCYFWNISPLAQLSNVFISSGANNLISPQYHIKEELLKINSINFFKNDIEPSWEDQANKDGGRFIFQVERSQENSQEIYQALVYYFLGEDFTDSERIHGIRFISAKKNSIHKFAYRVEIWVSFNKAETEKILGFKASLEKFLQMYHINNLSPSFKSNQESIK